MKFLQTHSVKLLAGSLATSVVACLLTVAVAVSTFASLQENVRVSKAHERVIKEMMESAAHNTDGLLKMNESNHELITLAHSRIQRLEERANRHDAANQ